MLTRLNLRIVSLILSLFLTNFCLAGSESYRADKSQQLVSDTESADYYCQKAETAMSPDRENDLLLCANALLKSGKTNEAKNILSQLADFPFEGNMVDFKKMVDARAALNQDKPQRALTSLKRISPDHLSLPVLIEYRDLKARAYAQEGNYLQSVMERVELDAQLSDREMAATNNVMIWDSLQHINIQTLQGASKSTRNPVLKGWLELAAIERQMNSNDSVYIHALSRWETEYPGHPAEALLPGNLSNPDSDELRPKHIALLLPLSGRLSSSAESIRDGFLAASHEHQRTSISAPIVSVVDTRNDQQVAAAYETAMSQGADAIVGPLTKKGVEEIMQVARGSVPVLALNYIDEHSPSNVFQFGLAPEDEARDLAARAWRDGHKRVLIVAQSGDWGDRITHAFSERWDQLGGEVVEVVPYRLNDNLSKLVKSALHVESSESRVNQLSADLNQDFEYDTRRRQDIDMIFMVAQPTEAHQLPPLFAFYFAQDLPVYATASAYSGQSNPLVDKDLDGVVICDIPWIINAHPNETEAKNPTIALWPNSPLPEIRLYALGVDAYQVLPILPRLEAFPNFSYNGATGRISLSPNRQLSRTLPCSEFASGEIKKLGSNG